MPSSTVSKSTTHRLSAAVLDFDPMTIDAIIHSQQKHNTASGIVQLQAHSTLQLCVLKVQHRQAGSIYVCIVLQTLLVGSSGASDYDIQSL